mmetsp:Transcript_17728/g.44001  ORF Transcript_17728/g.44001 Transcript_17728/m.44001 type:complete len:190 (+) Transcript_17728:400-969(+)
MTSSTGRRKMEVARARRWSTIVVAVTPANTATKVESVPCLMSTSTIATIEKPERRAETEAVRLSRARPTDTVESAFILSLLSLPFSLLLFFLLFFYTAAPYLSGGREDTEGREKGGGEVAEKKRGKEKGREGEIGERRNAECTGGKKRRKAGKKGEGGGAQILSVHTFTRACECANVKYASARQRQRQR